MRIQTSNCGGPVVVALRSTAVRVPGVEREAMLGAEDGGHLVDRLMLGAVLCCVHADRRGRHHPAALPGSDRHRGEGSTLVVASGLISNGFVGPAFAREHRMQGFGGLVRTAQAGDSEELAEQLPAEHAVVIQLLIAALELGHVVAGALLSGAPRRHRMKIKACEEIGPEIGHALSVSLVLRQRERNSQASWRRIRESRNPRLRRR